jgi:outer membrane protein
MMLILRAFIRFDFVNRATSFVQALSSLTIIALVLFVPNVESASLSEIYDLARSHDPQLRSAQAVSRAEAEVVIQRRSALLPEVNFTAETGYRNNNPSRFNDGRNDSYRISMTMPIVNSERWYSFRAGELLSNKATTQLAEVNQKLIERTMMAYMDVLETQTIHATALAVEAAVLRRLDQVQTQYEAGLVTVTEVGEARAAYDVAHVRRIIAKGELENGFEALFRLTGHRGLEEIDDLKPNYPIELLQPYTPQVWVDRALQYNLELQLARFDVSVTQKNLKSIRARHYPTVNLVANYGSETDTDRDGRDIDSGYVGVNLNIPVFQGGRTNSEIRESHYQRDATTEVLADLQLDVAEKTRTVIRSLNNDVVSIAAHRQASLSAKAALVANDTSYQVGTRSIDDVLTAEQRAQEAARDYEVARYSYVRNQISLKELLGELTVDDIDLLNSWLGSPEDFRF